MAGGVEGGNMGKNIQYASVHDWVDAEFQAQFNDGQHLSQQTLSISGMIVSEVQTESPAGLLGLEKGDILYAINGGVFDSDDLNKTLKPRRFGQSFTFDFLRVGTRKQIRIKGRTFPFGMRMAQSVDSFSISLRNGDPDPHDVCQFWETCDADALSKLWLPLEAYNIRMRDRNGSPFDGPLPQSVAYDAPLASSKIIWPGAFAWMALCAAHAGQWDRARIVLQAVEAHFDSSGDSGMMSMFAAMAYTRSMLAENIDDPANAVRHIEHAIEMSPEIEILYRRLAHLTGSTATVPPSPYLGMKPTYDLPQHDPSRRFIQSEGQVSLQEKLNKLNSGEFLLVCVMASYRTNGPYIEGFERAHIPLSRLRGIFRGVHVITSWDAATSRDLKRPIMEPRLEKSGVDIRVLYDVDGTVDEQLSLISAPTNLVIDHRGVIVADGWLGDDKVLWDALASRNALQ